MSRGLLGPVLIIPGTANNMTGTSAVTSLILDLKILSSASMQLVWSGTPTGSFSVQGSIDYIPNPGGGTPINAGTWTSIGLTIPSPAGSASNAIIDIGITAIPFLKIVYTNSSGTGTLSVMAFGKGI